MHIRKAFVSLIIISLKESLKYSIRRVFCMILLWFPVSTSLDGMEIHACPYIHINMLYQMDHSLNFRFLFHHIFGYLVRVAGFYGIVDFPGQRFLPIFMHQLNSMQISIFIPGRLVRKIHRCLEFPFMSSETQVNRC